MTNSFTQRAHWQQTLENLGKQLQPFKRRRWLSPQESLRLRELKKLRLRAKDALLRLSH